MGNVSMFEGLPRVESADRSKFVGASMAPVILGLSSFESPMGAWLKMTDPDAMPFSDNNATKRGRFLEAGILNWTASETGAVRVEAGIPIDQPGIAGPAPFMSFHPDGALHYDGGIAKLAEIKSSRVVAEWGEGADDLPLPYLAQVQWQLACLPNVEKAIVGAYLPIADSLRTYEVQRDDEFQQWMMDSVGEWLVKHVYGGVPPSLDASEATKVYLKKKWPKEVLPLRDSSEGEAFAVQQYLLAKSEAKMAEERADALAAQIKDMIGDAEGLRGAFGKLTWKWQDGAQRWDTKALEAAHPELAAMFKKRGEPMRVMRSASK